MNNDKFSRREFMRDGVIAAAGLAAGLGAVGRKSVYADAAKENRPNILFIYTDDQGSWTPEYAGNKQAHTPNMDRLRREGRRR